MTNKKYLEYAADILRSGRHLLDVVNSVLDLRGASPEDAAARRGRRLALRADRLRQDAARPVHARRPEAFHGVRPADAPVAGKKAKLRQIFLNLLSNAVKFTERGGEISIGSIATPPARSRSSSPTPGSACRWKTSRSRSRPRPDRNWMERRYEGTGLGLPLTKALIGLHRFQPFISTASLAGARKSRSGLPAPQRQKRAEPTKRRSRRLISPAPRVTRPRHDRAHAGIRLRRRP